MPDNKQSAGLSRRSFLWTSTATMLVVAAGCSSESPTNRPKPDGGPENHAPEWSTIADQVWTVGVPVSLDLKSFCKDVDGDTLTYTISPTLPPGLELKDGVITGTPTAVFAAAPFTATADDGKA